MTARDRPTPEILLARPRCPFCREDVVAGDGAWGCPACLAWHHDACRTEGAGRCAACGHATAVTDTDVSNDREGGAQRRPSEAIDRTRRTADPSGRSQLVRAGLLFMAGWPTAIGVGLLLDRGLSLGHDVGQTAALALTCLFVVVSGGLLLRARPLPAERPKDAG
jgi:hypothetical protein